MKDNRPYESVPEVVGPGNHFSSVQEGRSGCARNLPPSMPLSHARNVVYMEVLSEINEAFTPSKAQFGFQQHISVIQAIIAVDDNARRGLQHIRVLDLEKAYDWFD